ncbi:hypothetical protein QZH41_005899 [Actinostola sp. cb2023]|nr:hypothetical protein QZH41_005899 [Actinostola sp. cb2023]
MKILVDYFGEFGLLSSSTGAVEVVKGNENFAATVFLSKKMQMAEILHARHTKRCEITTRVVFSDKPRQGYTPLVNHSIRTMAITIWSDAEIPVRHIMNISRHANCSTAEEVF